MAATKHNELDPSQDLFHRMGERALKAVADHPKATRNSILVLMVAILAVWGGISYRRIQAQKAAFELVSAFALKDVVPESVLAQRRAEKAQARAASAAIAKGAAGRTHDADKDDGDDDGDDAKGSGDGDDGDDDGDDEAYDAEHAGLPTFQNELQQHQAVHKAFANLARTLPGPLAAVAALEAESIADQETTLANPETHHALQRAAAGLPGPNSLMPLAALRCAQRAEDAGDTEAALEAIERVVAAQVRFLGDEARLHKARLLMAKNDLDGANEALEDVQNNYPQTALADEVRIQSALLEALRSRKEAPANSHVAGAQAG